MHAQRTVTRGPTALYSGFTSIPSTGIGPDTSTSVSLPSFDLVNKDQFPAHSRVEDV